jgi:methionyl-tRNA formyltransferase
MRLVFFGSGSFGVPTLQRLRQVHEVKLVVTRPDRPAGRSRRPVPTPIGAEAREARISTFKPGDPNEPEAIRTIQSQRPDGIVVIAYGHKLGEDLLGETFAINLHGSLLPAYRGAAPIHWAIINGESHTGVTVIGLAQRMDAGTIYAHASTPIDPRETAGELHDRLALLGPESVLTTLERHETGTLVGRPQDPALVSRAPKLTKSDGTVGFDQPAPAVRCRIHGLTPWPGCTVDLAGGRLRIHRVEEVPTPDPNAEPGRLLDDGIVACHPGAVRILEVQPPGRTVMSFSAYAAGRMGKGTKARRHEGTK